MSKNDVTEYSDEEIDRRLVFATRLRGYDPNRELPSHLRAEENELKQEALRRRGGVYGEV